MKIYKSFLYIILFALTINFAFSQVRVDISSETQMIDGKPFYIHEVQKGQTLYSISNAYKCPIDVIKKVNRFENNDIDAGYLLKIPIDYCKIKLELDNTLQYIRLQTEIHIVQSGESLSRIAKKYNTNVDVLRKLNNGIDDAIRPGQEIIVPAISKNISNNSDNKNIHIVKQGETLYSIAKKYLITLNELKKLNPNISEDIHIGQEIEIQNIDTNNAAIDKEKCDCKKMEKLNDYNVAILIPLCLSNSNIKQFNSDNRDKNEWYENKSFSYLQFYEGFSIAIDSLNSLGMNINVYVFDLDASDNKIEDILNNPALKKMQLIFGPFEEKYIDKISEFGYENKIPVVSCYLTPELVLKEINPYFFNPISSIKSQMKGLSEYFVDEAKNSNLIIAYQSGGIEEKAALELDSFLREQNYTSQKLINISDNGLKAATNFFVGGKRENILVALANGDMYVGNMIRSLNEFKEKYNLTIFGLPGWLNYEIIDMEFLEFLNAHFFSSSFIDFDNDNVRKFISTFQKKYKTDPDKLAFLGYDLGIYYLTALNNFGPKFYKCIDDIKNNSITTNFSFNFTKADGYRNNGVSIYKMKDFQLWKIK